MIIRKFFILIFPLFFFTTIFYSQVKAIKVEYIQAVGKTSDTIYSKAKKLKGMTYTLRANSYISIFEKDKVLNNEAYGTNERYMFSSGANGVFYKNIKRKIKLRKLDFLGETIIISQPLDDYKWNITKEFKFIEGFKCYKAYYAENFYSPVHNKGFEVLTTAWFTPEIPFSFRPKGCDGLPGLVLEASYYNGSIYFIAQKIILLREDTKIGSLEFNYPKGVKTFTHDQYIEYSRKRFNQLNEN